MEHESPVINGNGEFSRDFTYIDNVVQMNIIAALTTNGDSINQVYNVAYGKKTSLNDLLSLLKESLAEMDPDVQNIEVIYGPDRAGDIPHSLASIEKAQRLLNYVPRFSLELGLKEAVKYYVATTKL